MAGLLDSIRERQVEIRDSDYVRFNIMGQGKWLVADVALFCSFLVNQLIFYGIIGQFGIILHFHLLQDT